MVSTYMYAILIYMEQTFVEYFLLSKVGSIVTYPAVALETVAMLTGVTKVELSVVCHP